MYEELQELNSSSELVTLRDEIKELYNQVLTDDKFSSIAAKENAKTAKEQAEIATKAAKEISDKIAALQKENSDTADFLVEMRNTITDIKKYLADMELVKKSISDGAKSAKEDAALAKASADNASASENKAKDYALQAKESADNAKTSEQESQKYKEYIEKLLLDTKKLSEDLGEIQKDVSENAKTAKEQASAAKEQADKAKEQAAAVAPYEDMFATRPEVESLIPHEQILTFYGDDERLSQKYKTYSEYESYLTVNKRLPWDVIDCSYRTKLDWLFSSSPEAYLKELPKIINCEMVTSARNAFSSNLRVVPKLKFSKDVDMYYAFANNSYIQDASDIEAPAVVGTYMFYFCGNLEKAPAKIKKLIGDCNSMFYYCKKLTSFPEYDTSQCTNMCSLFYGTGLEGEFPWAIDLSSITKTTGIGLMFSSTNITKVTFKNVRKVFNPDNPDNVLNGSTLATHIGNSNIEVVVNNYLSY